MKSGWFRRSSKHDFLLPLSAGQMYFRYFMWNFSGRQTDIQGDGSVQNGNWITGIKFLDAVRLGNQDNLPRAVTENKGRNVYYALPLILGCWEPGSTIRNTVRISGS